MRDTTSRAVCLNRISMMQQSENRASAFKLQLKMRIRRPHRNVEEGTVKNSRLILSVVVAGLDWQMGNVTLFAAGEATGTNDSAHTYAAKGGVRMGW